MFNFLSYLFNKAEIEEESISKSSTEPVIVITISKTALILILLALLSGEVYFQSNKFPQNRQTDITLPKPSK
ncbi:MAG: hypothetical protein AAFR62_15570 [Cyanobacteria bacterium J06629_2]